MAVSEIQSAEATSCCWIKSNNQCWMGNGNCESIIFIAQSADGGRALSIRYKICNCRMSFRQDLCENQWYTNDLRGQCLQKNVMFGHIGCTSEAVACTFGNQLSMVDNPRSFAVVLINARGQSRRPAGGFRKTAYLCILNNSSFKKKVACNCRGMHSQSSPCIFKNI